MQLYFLRTTVFSNALSKKLATLKWRVILKQRAKHWCVWEKSVHTSERISSFNICETLENHNQHQAEKIGKWRIVILSFFSPFPLNHGTLTLVPVVSPGLEKKNLIWNKHNLPGRLCCPLGCGSVHPSTEFREGSRQWDTAGDIWISGIFLCRMEGAAQLLSSCCPSLPKQKLFGPAEASPAKHLSERLRAAQPSTSHLRDQWWVISKEGS